MIALRWHDRRDVRLEDVELALPLGRGMVEVEVAYCGICGSDLAEFATGPFAIRRRPHALSGQEPPITLGHELSGRVTAVGEGVDNLAVGDRVAADACWRCGTCDACRSGRYNLCPLSGSIGLASDGGFASRVRFPAYCAVPLPDAVSDEAGALLEPLAVGLHALDRGGARPGDRVVVLGFGPIGVASAAIARAMGLGVLVSSRTPVGAAAPTQWASQPSIPKARPGTSRARFGRARTAAPSSWWTARGCRRFWPWRPT